MMTAASNAGDNVEGLVASGGGEFPGAYAADAGSPRL